MYDAFGPAILGISLLVGMVILGSYTLAYTAHCFLVVLEQSAAGSKDMAWPDEPFHDWLWKPLYLGWLIAVCLVPVGLLYRFGTTPLFKNRVFLFLLAVASLWLLLPLGLLSSLSATSRFMLLRPAVVVHLLRCPGSAMLFLAVSAALIGACAALVWYTLLGWQPLHEALVRNGWNTLADLLVWWTWLFVIPFTGAFLAAALLWYARLLGRLAWVITGAEERQPALPQELPGISRAEDKTGQPLDKQTDTQLEAPVTAPAGLPGAIETSARADLAIYPLLTEEPPRPPLQPDPASPLPPSSSSEEEASAPPSGPALLTEGLLYFPWLPGNLRVFGWLAFDSFCLLLMCRVMKEILPRLSP